MITQDLTETRHVWDAAAATFDEEPDHGLRDPVVREAWTNRLAAWLPSTPSNILDMGCGTGSLSVLLASLGHEVTGVDVSPAMLARAQAKAAAAERSIVFHVMDAAHPTFAPRRFDVIVCRHLLWTLPEPAQVLQRWADLLTPKGRLVLVEGYWFTDAGLHATAILEALPHGLTDVTVENLSDQPELWGQAVKDERYVIQAALSD